MLKPHKHTVFLGQTVRMEDFHFDVSRAPIGCFYTNDRTDPGRYSRLWSIRAEKDIYHMSFRLCAYGGASVLEEFIYRLTSCRESISLLGPGYVCRHCGSLNQSGTLICVWCGGATEEIDWVVPQKLDMAVSEYGFVGLSPFVYAEEPMMQTREFETVLKTDPEIFVRSLISGNISLLPTGCTLESGYYLCQKCGGSVRVGDLCPGCGGNQIPLSEIIKMDRRCVYCGTKTKGDIVCRGCNARVSGLTYKKWKSRQARETSKAPLYP